MRAQFPAFDQIVNEAYDDLSSAEAEANPLAFPVPNIASALEECTTSDPSPSVAVRLSLLLRLHQLTALPQRAWPSVTEVSTTRKAPKLSSSKLPASRSSSLDPPSKPKASSSVRPSSPLATLTLTPFPPAAIRDPNPTLFLEPKILYRSAVEQVPVGDFQLPLSSAEIMQEGTDLTIVSYGPPLYTIETALHVLKNPGEDVAHNIPMDLRGLSVELIDLRTIQPYDVRSFLESFRATS